LIYLLTVRNNEIKREVRIALGRTGYIVETKWEGHRKPIYDGSG